MSHGTLPGYYHGCHCDQCREAHTAYMRDSRYGGYRRDRCECGGEKYARAKRCWACRVNANAAAKSGEDMQSTGEVRSFASPSQPRRPQCWPSP